MPSARKTPTASDNPWLWLSLAVLAVLLAVPTGYAQEDAGSADPAQGAPSTPAAMSLSDLVRHTQESEVGLLRLEKALAPDPMVEAIGRSLSGLEAVPQIDKTSEMQRLARLSNRLLLYKLRGWEEQLRRVELWQAAIGGRMQALLVLEEEIAVLESSSAGVRSAAMREEIPGALIRGIAEVQEQLDATRERLTERLSRILDLEAQLSERASALSRLNEWVGSALEEELGRLLARRDLPLWKVLAQPVTAARELRQDLQRVFAAKTEDWREDVAAFTRYLDANPGRLVSHLAAFVLLLALLLALHRRSRDWVLSDPALRASSQVLAKPVSSALLLALLLTPFLYPVLPLLIYDLYVLAALAGVTRLLPGLVYRGLRGPLYGLIAILVLEVFWVVFLDDGLLARLVLLAMATSALALLIWILRSVVPDGRGGGWLRAGKLATWLACLVLTTSVIANVVGSVDLADVLASASLTSLRTGILLFLAALVLDGLVMVLLRTRQAQTLRSMRLHTELLQRRALALVNILAVGLWIRWSLAEFQALEPFRDWLSAALSWRWTRGNLAVSAGDILAFLLVVVGTFLLSRFLRFLLEEDVLPHFRLARGVPATISILVNYLVLGVGFLFALAAAGIEPDRVVLLVGALGVGIGFGLQDLVHNFVSGLILVFERPIKIEDVIEVGSLVGRVRRIGMRSSTIRTLEGAEVVVPNGKLLSNEVVNWTLSDRQRRVEIPVGVAYGTDPEAVITILEQAADHPRVLHEPKPVALFKGIGESSLDFELRVWTPSFDNWWQVASDLRVAITAALGKSGIEIPFPQRDLRLRSVDAEAGKTPDARSVGDERTP
ncbi:MAG: mechanosensitive ion channel [bacterium]|nr:mechanosensitive ion channel [bacterium]